MLESFYKKNVFSYLSVMETISFIDDFTLFSYSMSMFGKKVYITDLSKGKSEKIIDDEDFIEGGSLNGFIFYTKGGNDILYRYNISLKIHQEIAKIPTNDIVVSNNSILNCISANELNGFDSDGKIIKKYTSKIDCRKYKSFKMGCIVQNVYDYEYKDAYIDLSNKDDEMFNPIYFKSGEWDASGDLLAVACTNYTKVNIQPKLKILTTNSTDTEWIVLSELNADYGIELVKVKNGLIYIVDHNFVLRIFDINCKELKTIQLNKDVLCFDVSPNSRKMAYAYMNCIKVIDI